MKKFHVAISVSDIGKSIDDYSTRLNCKPCVIIENEYALWRTDILNLSIRKSNDPGKLRHLGWEDPAANQFTEDKDVNGIIWEKFNSNDQLQEIRANWPDVNF